MRTDFIITVAMLLAVLGLSSSLTGQTQRPAFEVASIKRSAPDQRSSPSSYKGETFILPKATLGSLIQFAYGMGPLSEKPFATLEGEPRWGADRFDIVAKTAGPVQPPSQRTMGPLNYMVQSLLAERFKLAVHWETKEGSVFALVLARSDRTLGPQMRQSTVDCDAWRAEITAGTLTLKPNILGAPRERPVCGAAAGPKRGGTTDVAGTREILLGTEPLKTLMSLLSQNMDRPIVDRTGLAGNFDVELRFAPQQRLTAAVPSPNAPTTTPPVAPDPGPGWPPLADALRDQLGLKLEVARGPIEVLVIDAVALPTEN